MIFLSYVLDMALSSLNSILLKNGLLQFSRSLHLIIQSSFQLLETISFALMGRPTGLEPANAGATIQSVDQLHHGRHIWLAHVILSYFWVFVNRYNPILFSMV